MTTFTTDDLRASADDVLAAAKRDGEARVRTGSGDEFRIRLVEPARSPLDVGSIDLGMTADEIVAYVREGREREVWPPKVGPEDRDAGHPGPDPVPGR